MLDFYCIFGDYKEVIKIWENKILEVYRIKFGDYLWIVMILFFIVGLYKVFVDEKIDFVIDCIREVLEFWIKLLDVY